MYKRLMFLFALALLLVGCFSKDYVFRVTDEVIVMQQSEEEFNISMLEGGVALFYGESEQSIADVEIDGTVNLNKVGVYPITLVSTYKKKVAQITLEISVVDTVVPEFHVFEKELLVYTDEQLDINSQHFFINLTDGINGLINSRITTEDAYDLKTVGTYPIGLVGTDASGNRADYDIKLRVTDMIDEKAHYLFDKANVAAHGQSFVFRDNNKDFEIINLDDALAVFTPNYKEHFFWLSGLTGEYNNNQSGVKLSKEDGAYFADYSGAKKVSGYQQTKLMIQYETDNYRHYLAESTYEENGEEVIRNSRFVIRKIEGAWYVEEFYIPN